MDKFTTHSGTVMPLRRSDVDTDQIIPAVYLKRVTRTGFEDGLFNAWRDDPGFVLNNPAHAGATNLVAGPKEGLLPVQLELKAVEALWEMAESEPAKEIVVDLSAREVRVDDAVWTFPIDDFSRWRLLEGLDDIGLTLRHADAIDAYEATRPAFKPVTV